MKSIYEFTGCIIRKSGCVPEVGNRVYVEYIQGTSCKEDFVVRSWNGFVGYPDEESCCKLYEGFERGKNVSAEILTTKKEGIYDALFTIS